MNDVRFMLLFLLLCDFNHCELNARYDEAEAELATDKD